MQYWWVIFYLPIYLLVFAAAEKQQSNIHIIGLAIDKHIPFCEYFIIPYLLWFPYIALVFVLIFFANKKEFLRMTGLLYVGMTVFLAVSFIYPNGLNLRPVITSPDNLCLKLVAALYSTDTSTNVFPSIHVYNSIAVCIGMHRVFGRREGKCARIAVAASDFLSFTIVLSTMFLKQHSVIDVIGAFALITMVYFVIYLRKTVRKAVRKTADCNKNEENRVIISD